MGLDERLFQWLSNKLRGRRSSEERARELRAAAAEPLLTRLRNVAAAVAGGPVSVGIVDGRGLIVGRLILFPRLMSDAAKPEENIDLLVAFATFAGARIANAEAGGNADHDDDGVDVAALRTLVALSAMKQRFTDELPGYPRSIAALLPSLLADRPLPSSLTGRAAGLEHLVRAHLGAAADVDTRAEVAAVVAAALAAVVVNEALLAVFSAVGRKTAFVLPSCWSLTRRGTTGEAVAPGGSGAAEPRGITTELEGRKRPPARRRRTLQEHKKAENPLTHSFEKVHTVEEHKGGQKRADGSDELADHAAALDEVELEEVVLSSETAASVYNAGAPSGDIDDVGARVIEGIRYDEWDSKRRRYLPGYCHVSAIGGGVVKSTDLARGAALLRRVKRDERAAIEKARTAVLSIVSARRWQRRQLDGPEVDIDAAIDRITTLRAGHEGSRNVYQARRRSARELAVLVLLDASFSTDAWVDNRRVLDVERDAATIIAAACDGLLDEVSIAAFFSDTHEDCRYIELRGFDETVEVGAARLSGLEPAGYTRLGPAIRHGVRQLAECRARRRLLVILTDGKPGDRDRYEGQHGEGDVRQAIREAAGDHVDVLALGADPRATATLWAMCGRRSAAGLSQASDVANAVAEAIAVRLAR